MIGAPISHSETGEALAARYLGRMAKTTRDRIDASRHKEFVGSQLALARTALGFSQAALARRYGMKGNKLNQWERGLYYPEPWFMKQFCDDYGFTLDWFYRGLKAGVSSERADDLRRVEAERTEA